MNPTVANQGPVGPDTLITVKVLIDGQNRRFKLALRDLGAHVLPQKLRFLLGIPAEYEIKFDRFSDSAGTYIELDSTNPSVYKQLYRAAKAKLKLRLRATVIPTPSTRQVEISSTKNDTEMEQNKQASRNTYLETVLSHNPIQNSQAAAFQSMQTVAPPPPVPCISVDSTRQSCPRVQIPAALTRVQELSRPTLPSLNDFCSSAFSIDCNHCNKSVPDEHYHCGICEKGDFDLCLECIDQGATCDGEDHWLIKRTIKNGRVFPSVTETFSNKKKSPAAEDACADFAEDDQRTCNCCIIQLPATSFVTCQTCPDFDLCFSCLENGEHGHHPAHPFAPVDGSSAAVTSRVRVFCQQGRGLQHEAICDGCDSQICGVRHKCLSCPDFDYCSACVESAASTHAGHRFAPIYEHLEMTGGRKEYHRGIYCDGPLCTANPRKSYIRGDRYKCSVCHDTDFCANCEALPTNTHNKSHPLIKLKTAIRAVVVNTVNEPDDGSAPTVHGDRPAAKHASTETIRSTSTNAATQVHTVAEVKPVEIAPPEVVKKEDVAKTPDVPAGLQAWFESDSTPDGSSFAPNRLVSQSWTLRNPGPQAWPAGCAVYYIGGDDMRNLDDKHPSSVSDMSKANRSNVLEEPLQPGKTAVFTVLLKSPPREGRAISYWRLKTPEGVPFGHKLWVDITVSAKAIKPVEAPAPVPMKAPVSIPIKDDADKEQGGSQMIFPKLEKESPESSVHTIEQAPSVPADPSIASEDQDLLDDLDSMALDEESTEDGFMTDEEYDILDAEDEEYLMEAERAVKHQ